VNPTRNAGLVWNRILVGVLFVGLVLALLWFQGLILRPEHATTVVPGPPALGPNERVARVELRKLARTQSQPGFVEAIDAAHVSARVMSNVLAVSAREGDRVDEGAVLLQLDDRDAKARLAQAIAGQDAAQAQATAARLAFERVERLKSGAAATEQEWESARAAHEGAVASLERAAQGVAEARTAFTWFEVRTPFAGRVLARHVEPGQLAAPGQPLITLYRDEQLRVAVAVPQEHAGRFEVGTECELEFDAGLARRGTVARVLPAADPSTGAVTLHLALADVSGLRPGQLARLEAVVGEREALLAPASAVERIGQIERVRAVKDGCVTPVLVRTGKRHGDWIEILSGLRAGEDVVTKW
jgi:RND family efflux transporter MFP subunit